MTDNDGMRVTDLPDTPLESAAAGWAPPPRTLLTMAAAAGAGLLGAGFILSAWSLPPFSSRAVRTDDAYVSGLTTLLSPQVSGYVGEVAVTDFEPVREGQVLLRIDDRVYRQRLAQAQADLAAQLARLAKDPQTRRSRAATLAARSAALDEAVSQLERAGEETARTEPLAKQGWITASQRDDRRAALAAAQAAVRQAKAEREVALQDVQAAEADSAALDAAADRARAALELARIDLANTAIRAPRPGRLGAVAVHPGQYVTSGSQLLFLVPETVWVTANFKERQAARIEPGRRAWISVDALAGARLEGRVSRLAPATGSEFSALKPDGAAGNFVKVPQRISVRIDFVRPQSLTARLRPGMSVEATIDAQPRD